MDQVRTLLWLKTRLTLALYRKKAARWSLLLVAPAALMGMFGLYFAGLVVFWGLPPEQARQMLNGGLTAVYVGWLFGPLVGFGLNEGYDISKLLNYPVTGHRIFVANILGSALDKSILFLSVPLLSIVVGLGNGWVGGALIMAALLVFLFHTVALSQAFLTLLWGLLRSRRVADLWKVLVGLCGAFFAVAYNVLAHRMDRVFPALVLARPAAVTRFLPSGLAADAVMAAHHGDAQGFAWRFGILVIVCVATVVLAGGLVERVASGELILDRVGMAARPAQRERRAGWLPSWVPPATAAMCQLELRIAWRDPQAKVELLQRSAGILLWPILMFTSSSGLPRDAGHGGAALFAAPMGFMALMLLASASSIFARDRGGLTLLFTLPAPRIAFFHGKNLATLLLSTPMNAIILLVVAFFLRNWTPLLPAFLIGEGVILMCLGEGNLFSVYAPTPAPARGQNPYASRRGCSFMGCLGPILGLIALQITAAPAVLAFLVPVLWAPAGWHWLTVPLALLYSAGCYHLATLWAARALLGREPEILKAITRVEA